jgi:hypothetical protein
MTKEKYWQLMDHFREKSENDLNFFHALGHEVISELEQRERIEFYLYTGRYMEKINECVWLDMACKAINGYVSDDTSLYFNLWVMAQGKEVLLNALKDPDSLSELEYIPFMGLPGLDKYINMEILDGEDEESFFESEMLGELSPDILEELNRETYGEGAQFESLSSMGLLEEDYDFIAYNAEYLELEDSYEEDETDKIRLTKEQISEIDEDIVFMNDSKYGNYESFEDAMDDLENVVPKLLKRRKDLGLELDLF